jgi:hypothetical protein
MEEAGRTLVGPSNTILKKVVVPFTNAFSAPPVVVANTLQTDPSYPPASIPDTFAVSITGVTNTQFQANILRVDNPQAGGWGQKLSLGWMAETP